MMERPILRENSKKIAHFIPDFSQLENYVEVNRKLGLKIVMTDGTYDMIHVGHLFYLEAASNEGDLLIVGMDSDEKTRRRKGPDRPVIPQDERIALLRGFRCVDVVTIKENDHPKWSLIKKVHPDVLIKSSSTKAYTPEELEALREFCGRVQVLPPQGTTSTSANIRRLQIGGAKKLAEAAIPIFERQLPQILEEAMQSLQEEKGGK
jgi:rfaE bifunctional protein nucleotidyltransferase chain/domain